MAPVYASKGHPHMELFSVVVHNHSGKPLNLYGSIEVSSSNMHDQFIYKRGREDSECFSSESKGIPLLLDGAPQFIAFGRNFVFDVDLKHRVEDADIYFYEKLCSDVIGVRCEEKDIWRYNELLNFRLDGKGCSVEVSFGLYRSAAIARVTATVINLKMKNIKVYGQITSQTSLIVNASKVLLNKKPKDGIMVHQHDRTAVLQFPGSLVVAPLDSELTITANLYGCLDGQVCTLASGTANFYVKVFGMSEAVISGIGCDIQVEVDWLSF